MSPDARAAYDAAIALVPSLADHVRIPGSQRFVNGVNEAWALLERALALDPDLAVVHAARGNVLVRAGQTDAAREAYARAAELDPDDAAARFALAELAHLRGDHAGANELFEAAFARQRCYSPPAPRATRAALVLGVGGPWPRNMPLDFIVDDAQWTLHRWFLPDPHGAERAVPAHDVIVNAIGVSAAAATAIAAAARIIAAAPRRAINDPAKLAGTARDRLGATLAGIDGCVVPAAARAPRALLQAGELPASIAFPALVRPLDTHGGRGLERVANAAELGAYAQRVEAAEYDVSTYVDYRSADGFFRKYRIMFVDGVAYPYHLALDTAWMIHYYRTPMGADEAMRAEEARFLDDPAAAFATWTTAVPAVAAAIGLDYVGIDCAQLPDGRLLVFEADAAMLVHGIDPGGIYAYKRPSFDRIRAAFAALLETRAS